MPDVPNITSARLGSRLRELGLVLPKAPTPLGAYVESNQVGSLLFLSGTLPVVNRKLSISGRLGENLSVEQGREAARLAALNALALAQQHVGDLDRVKKLVKLTVLMVTTEQFVEHPAVADGRGIVAALTLGADAVQIGTAFLACDESGASALHRKLLFQDDAKYTSLSRAFTGRLARGIYHGFASEMKMHEPLFAKYPAIVGSLPLCERPLLHKAVPISSHSGRGKPRRFVGITRPPSSSPRWSRKPTAS